MNKHTPGPWVAVGAWVEVESDDIADICTCHPEDFHQKHLKRSDAEIMANARLIAAAPELLEALELIMKTVAGCQKEPYWEAARAAIAKATGEQV